MNQKGSCKIHLVYVSVAPTKIDVDDPLLWVRDSDEPCFFHPPSDPDLGESKTMETVFNTFKTPLQNLRKYVEVEIHYIAHSLHNYKQIVPEMSKSTLSKQLQDDHNKEDIQKALQHYVDRLIEKSEILEKVLSGQEFYGNFYDILSSMTKFNWVNVSEYDIKQTPLFEFFDEEISRTADIERCSLGEKHENVVDFVLHCIML